MARRLIRKGYLVREFDSGEALVACLQEKPGQPDVIFLDFKMPGINGLETCHAIRHISPPTPVILFTAYPGALNVPEAKEKGLFEVLTKDVELENLMWVIRLAMGSEKE